MLNYRPDEERKEHDEKNQPGWAGRNEAEDPDAELDAGGNIIIEVD